MDLQTTLLYWGFGLLLASMLLFVVECFVPSGGLIGVTASVVAIAGIVTFWRVSWVWGSTSLLVMLILVPTALNFALRIMPNTPMGKHLILSGDPEAAQRRALEETRHMEQQQALVGTSGTALTDLRPIGQVEIDGTRLEVLAEGPPVSAGQRIRVTSVSGNQVKVRGVA
jgi:membrane-bound ClpP family serine protease